MPSYRAFGGVLESSLTLPSMTPVDRPLVADWTLRSVESLPARPELTLLGRAPVAGEASVALYSYASGYRLDYDDTGIFDISVDGSALTYVPGPRATPEKVEADVLGRVLAVALHAAGRFCLHGSAVSLASGAIAFLAPKHSGKSTLALAATRRGARLLSDDSLAVDLRAPALAYPGVHGVRLWDDSLSRLAANGTTRPATGGKQVLNRLPSEQLEHEPRPLRTIYLLTPRAPDDPSVAVERQALPAFLAAVALLRDAKISALLGGSEAPVLLAHAAALASLVPVYALRFVRDYDRLEGVVDQLVAWRDRDAQAATGGPVESA